MKEWIGKKRRWINQDVFVVEEIMEIGQKWVSIRSYEKDEVSDERMEYGTKEELLEALHVLDYR